MYVCGLAYGTCDLHHELIELNNLNLIYIYFFFKTTLEGKNKTKNCLPN